MSLQKCNFIACFLIFLVRKVDSLNPYWGCHRSRSPSRSTSSFHIAKLKPRRHVAAFELLLLSSSSSSSSDHPHPPEGNPPEEIFFASDIQSPSIIDSDKEQEADDLVLNNRSAKTVLERYVDNKVESVKAKEMARNIDQKKNDSTSTITIVNGENSSKNEMQAELSKLGKKGLNGETKIDYEKERSAEEQTKNQEEKEAQVQAEAKLTKLEWEEEQAKLAEGVRIFEERREAEIREWSNKAMDSVENAVKPLLDIQKGVPTETLKGAAIAGAAIGLMASKGVIASSAVGLSAAYVAISKSLAGDLLRTVGAITWDVTETATKLADTLTARDNAVSLSKDVVERTILKYKREKALQDGLDADNGFDQEDAADMTYLESEDDLVRVLQEAEAVINEADAAIAKAEADAEQIAKEKQPSGLILDDENEATEDGVTQIVEKDDSITNELVQGDTSKIVEEELFDRDAQQFLDDEGLNEDSGFDDDELRAAVEMAQEGIEGKIIGVDDIITNSSTKAEWDAAGLLANELRQDENYDEEGQEEDGMYELDESELENLAKAARYAVESYENNAKEVKDGVNEQKQQWANSVIHDDDEFEDSVDISTDKNHLDEIKLDKSDSIDEVGENNEVDKKISDSKEDVNVVPVSNDWSSFRVVELKEELKLRGLKTSGRKADLISLLVESDAKLQGDGINGNADDFYVKDGEESDVVIYEDIDESEAIAQSDDDEDDDDYSDNDDDEYYNPVLEDYDIEELGRQARASVEAFQQSRTVEVDKDPTEERLTQLDNGMPINWGFDDDNDEDVDFTKMTVKELKVQCRSRGLKIGGRKADLIERLQTNSD